MLPHFAGMKDLIGWWVWSFSVGTVWKEHNKCEECGKEGSATLPNKQTAHLLPPAQSAGDWLGKKWVALPFEQSARDVVLPAKKTWWLGRPWAEQGAGWRPQLAMFGLADTDSLAQAMHYCMMKITGKNYFNFYFALGQEPEQKLLNQRKQASLLLFFSQNHVGKFYLRNYKS